jgi:hypothetical protein
MLTRWAVFETGEAHTIRSVHVCEHAAQADAQKRTVRNGIPHYAIEQIISSEHVFEEFERLRRSMTFSIK